MRNLCRTLFHVHTRAKDPHAHGRNMFVCCLCARMLLFVVVVVVVVAWRLTLKIMHTYEYAYVHARTYARNLIHINYNFENFMCASFHRLWAWRMRGDSGTLFCAVWRAGWKGLQARARGRVIPVFGARARVLVWLFFVCVCVARCVLGVVKQWVLRGSQPPSGTPRHIFRTCVFCGRAQRRSPNAIGIR